LAGAPTTTCCRFACQFVDLRPGPGDHPAMDGLSNRLQALVSAFIKDVASAVRASTIEALEQALQPSSEARAKPISTTPAKSTPARGRLHRRNKDAIAAMKGRLLAAIASKPGMRSEELRARLRIDRRELVLPLRNLVAERRVKTTGAKRATKYFPARAMTSRRVRRHRTR
jgi:hypothetical protein